MILTAKKLRELGKEELADELSEIYLKEFDDVRNKYAEALKKPKGFAAEMLRYHEVSIECYHFLTD